MLAAAPSIADLLAVDFELPDDLIATEPVESSGGGREDVRLMVARRSDDRLVHTTFRRLGDLLGPGDLLVVNTSATLAAAVPIVGSDAGLLVHLSTELPGGLWLVEVRRPVGPGSRPAADGDGRAGRTLALPGEGRIDLLAPYPAGGPPARGRFATLRLPRDLHPYLARYGRPIRYGYVH